MVYFYWEWRRGVGILGSLPPPFSSLWPSLSHLWRYTLTSHTNYRSQILVHLDWRGSELGWVVEYSSSTGRIKNWIHVIMAGSATIFTRGGEKDKSSQNSLQRWFYWSANSYKGTVSQQILPSYFTILTISIMPLIYVYAKVFLQVVSISRR